MKISEPRGPVGVVDEHALMLKLPAVRAWLVQHGFDAPDVSRRVELLGSGHVMLKVWRRDRAGRTYTEPGAEAPAHDFVQVAPISPFPVTKIAASDG